MKRILIVDDNTQNLYLLRALLAGHGYAVEEARNGEIARAMALTSPPDMVISDLFMPVLDGYGFLRFTLPILPGKTATARSFLQELEGPRKQDLAACGQSVGIAKEVWAIQQTPQGDMFVAYMVGDDIAESFRQVAASQTEFDRWFKRQLQETTGADLNTPPPGPISEILVDTMA